MSQQIEQSQIERILHSRCDAIAYEWYQSIAETSHVSLSWSNVRNRFTEMTEQIITLLLQDHPDPSEAQAIGAALARFHLIHGEVLGQTHVTLALQIVKDLPTDWVMALQPRLAELFGDLTTGFFRQATDIMLTEQEQIRSVLIADLQARGEAPQQAYDELEAKIAHRTKELEKINRELQIEISERALAEEALRQSEENFRALAENARDGIMIAVGRGNHAYVNQRAAEITGYSVPELLKIGFRELSHPDELDKIKDRYRKRLEGSPIPRQYETLIIKKDGKTIPVEVTGARTIWQEQPAVLAIIRDITERIQAENALRRRTKELEALHQIAMALSSTLEVEHVLDQMLDHLARLVPYDSGAVMLVNDGWARVAHFHCDERFADEKIVRQITSLSFEISQTKNLRWMAKTKRPLIITDTQTYPGWRVIPSLAYTRSWAGAPISVQGQVVAFFSLDKAEPDFFQPEHTELLKTFSGTAALALQNAHLFEQIHAASERLGVLSHRLLEVQETERHHIARELHDEIGQTLTALKLVLDAGMRSSDNVVKAKLAEAQTLVDSLVARVRDLSLDLRPAMLDDLGLLPTLLWHFERYTARTAVQVRFKHTGIVNQRFAPEVETAAYRIVQEALTNVARHAGVNVAKVRVWAADDILGVQVEDAGVGFDPQTAVASGNTGLAGMHERAMLLGGRLSIESELGGNTCLTAELPLGNLFEDSSGDALQ